MERPAQFAFALLFIAFHFPSFAESLEINVALSPAGSFVAKTNQVKGHAVLKEDAVLAQNIEVDLKDLKTGIALRDSHTQKHLETDKFPAAVLIKGVGKNGKGKAQLNFRGQQKVIEGTYNVSKDKRSVEAKFPLVLSQFGITGIKYMGVGVKDEVTVRVTVPVKQ